MRLGCIGADGVWLAVMAVLRGGRRCNVVGGGGGL